MLLLSVSHAVTFVIGDAFPSDGSGDFDLSQGNGNGAFSGTNGIAGNEVDYVYRVSDGGFGNPFNGGNPGGNFSPIVVGNIFGTDYRSTLSFDLSGLPAAPAGFAYNVTSIDLYLEVSSTDEVVGSSVTVDIFAGTGVTAGPLSGSPDASFSVSSNAPGATFLPPIAIPTTTLDLVNDSEYLLTLDVADPNNGIRFGSSLSTSADPNFGINGTNFVQVAPRLRIEADLVAIPEPSTITLLSLFSLWGMMYRRRR